MEFIDLKSQYKVLEKSINDNIEKVLLNADFIMGAHVEEFEKKLADYLDVKFAVSCSDGTAALQLVYMLKKIGPGDAVFCPDMTFIASIEPACMLGATPVFCDIEMDSYNISPESLERQIKNVIHAGDLTPKAVVAVDFLGNPADYDQIQSICQKYGLLLIEDAAQGMGGIYKGKKCGALAEIATTSFFPSKPLGCYGDGGAVFTNSEEEAEILKSIRQHGKGKSKYYNVRIGVNARLDTIQAAVLLAKLSVLEDEMEKRQAIAKKYEDLLGDEIITPHTAEYSRSAFAQYVIRVGSEDKRTEIIQRLKENDIPTLLYYPTPLHMMPVFQGIQTYGEDYRNAIKYSETSFGLPFSPYLREEDTEKICHEIKMCI